MTDQPPSRADREPEPRTDEQPGSDPGAAYDLAVDEGQVEPADEPDGPDAGDVFRSGS